MHFRKVWFWSVLIGLIIALCVGCASLGIILKNQLEITRKTANIIPGPQGPRGPDGTPGPQGFAGEPAVTSVEKTTIDKQIRSASEDFADQNLQQSEEWKKLIDKSEKLRKEIHAEEQEIYKLGAKLSNHIGKWAKWIDEL